MPMATPFLLRCFGSLVLFCSFFSSLQAFGQTPPQPLPHRKPVPTSRPAKPAAKSSGQTKPAAEADPAVFLQRHFDAAQKAEEAGNTFVAESEYREALGISLGFLGQTYQTLGDLDPAADAFEAALGNRLEEDM